MLTFSITHTHVRVMGCVTGSGTHKTYGLAVRHHYCKALHGAIQRAAHAGPILTLGKIGLSLSAQCRKGWRRGSQPALLA